MTIAVGGPVIFLAAGLLAGAHGALIALLVLFPTPALGLAFGLYRRKAWPALDVLWWMDRRAEANWRQLVGGSMPRNPAGARTWLEAHSEGSVPAWTRVTVMIVAGRLSSARAAIAAMPDATPQERRRRRELEFALATAEGRPVDTSAVDAVIREDTDETPEHVAIHLAYHGALAEADTGGYAIAPLLAVRDQLGRLPSDLRRRLWIVRFRYAAVSLFTGAWLLVAVVVGLATSGGVVWF